MKEQAKKHKRKKVLLVVPTLSTGGAEKFVWDMALHINRELFEVAVIVLFPRMGTKKEQDLEQAGIPVYYLNKPKGISFRCMWKAQKLIRHLNPDVIHSHLDVLPYLFLCYKRRQVKLHTVHSMAAFEAPGLQKWVRKIAFKYFGVTPVAIGETVKESIVSYYNLEPEAIPCIYNGVSEPTAKECEPHEKTVFVSVGTLYYVKNHEMLIRAFKRCVERVGDSIRLHIVGDGELRDVLKQQIAELGLDQFVDLIGWTDDVYAELRHSDVYVCTSILEGVSLSIIEAMLCGLPIIATDVGGNKDLVKPGFNGVLVENRNEDALADAMLVMLNDQTFRERCAKASKEISAQFTITACVEKYEALYRA